MPQSAEESGVERPVGDREPANCVLDHRFFATGKNTAEIFFVGVDVREDATSFESEK